MTRSARVLLVDDDKTFIRMVSRFLESEGFQIDVAHRGDIALDRIRDDVFDAMVLDLMMPGLSGHEVLRRLSTNAEGRPVVPILLLSAKGDEVERIVGLESGADDFLAKPCALRELAARLRAVLRRSVRGKTREDSRGVLRFDDLTLDTGGRRVCLSERSISVTDTEFAILRTLMVRGGGLVTKDDLSMQALGRPYLPNARSLDVHIGNLRQKLGTDAAGHSPIRTIRGRGYLLATAGSA
ncbi:MAG: response regulator transcription factor [Pseudomonadota bacterium]